VGANIIKKLKKQMFFLYLNNYNTRVNVKKPISAKYFTGFWLCYNCVHSRDGYANFLLIFCDYPLTMGVENQQTEERKMAELYGDDFITITDDEGNEYELEILSTLEYEGNNYVAVIPAQDDDTAEELEVSILKKVMEDGEEILVTIDDDDEMEKVYEVMMDLLYEEEQSEE
jgi:uncharacterized protein YrzB (UPF0473 family)